MVKEHRFLRCCGTAYVSCRARFIVTLDASASKDTLSEGLMQQLSIFALDVPPLRDRKEDIVPLFSSLVSREIDRLRFAGNSSVKQLLEYYSWRGNGAELAAACKRYAFSLNHITRPTAAARLNLLIQAIGEDKLLNEIIRRHPSLADGEKADTDDFMDGIADMKKILRYSNSQIAEKLSLSRTTLWRMTREKESIRQ